MMSHPTRSRVTGALLLIGALLLLGACAAGPNELVDTGPDPAGFWLGLWQGLISPITFIVSLFTSSVNIYEVQNNGNWYDFGFMLGVACARQRRWGRRFRSEAYAEAQPRLDSWQQKEAGPATSGRQCSQTPARCAFHIRPAEVPDVRAGQAWPLRSCGRGWMLSKECACYHYEKS